MDERQDINRIRQDLEGMDFPATRQDLMDRIGTRRVRAGDEELELRHVLGRMDRERFGSQDEVVRALQDEVPELRS